MPSSRDVRRIEWIERTESGGEAVRGTGLFRFAAELVPPGGDAA